MIIFGLRSGNAKQQAQDLADCAYCGTKQSVQLYFHVRYFHIFWIPAFPLYKTGVSQCNHCRQVLEKARMPPHLQAHYANARSAAKIPLKYYSWLIIAALFVTFAIFAVITENKDTRVRLQQPQAGDVYEIKDDGIYTLHRLKDVDGDTLWLQPHQYTADKPAALRKLKNDYANAYQDTAIRLTKSDLNVMYEARILKKINRR